MIYIETGFGGFSNDPEDEIRDFLNGLEGIEEKPNILAYLELSDTANLLDVMSSLSYRFSLTLAQAAILSKGISDSGILTSVFSIATNLSQLTTAIRTKGIYDPKKRLALIEEFGMDESDYHISLNKGVYHLIQNFGIEFVFLHFMQVLAKNDLSERYPGISINDLAKAQITDKYLRDYFYAKSVVELALQRLLS